MNLSARTKGRGRVSGNGRFVGRGSLGGGIRIFTLLVALALIAAACGDDDGPTATPTPTTAGTAATTPTPTTAGTATTEPVVVAKQIDELVVARAGLATEAVDPMLATVDDKEHLRLFHMPLFGMDRRDRVLCPCDGFAEEWSWSDDGLTLTINLRQGVKFHNGDDATAEDVKFSLERLLNEEARAPRGPFIWEVLNQIEIVNDHLVKFHVNFENVFLVPLLSALDSGPEPMIVPKAYIEEVGQEAYNNNPVGAGPYRLVERQLGSHMTFEAFEDYFLGTPTIPRIRLEIIPEASTRIARLRTGEAHIVGVARADLPRLEEEGFATYAHEGMEILSIFFHPENLKESDDPWTKEVREALELSVDRETIRDELMEGRAVLSGNTLWGAAGWQAIPATPFDPARAQELLRTAGYEDGELEFTIYAITKPELPEMLRIAEFMAATWAEIGVVTKIVPVDWPTMRPKVRGGGKGRDIEIAPDIDLPSIRLHNNTVLFFKHNHLGVVHGCFKTYVGVCEEGIDELAALAPVSTSIEDYGDALQASAQFMADNFTDPVVMVFGEDWAADAAVVPDWDLGLSYKSYNLRYLFFDGLLE